MTITNVVWSVLLKFCYWDKKKKRKITVSLFVCLFVFFYLLGPVEQVQLLAPFVVIRNKEVNVTAMVLPSHPRTVTYFWWLGNNTEVVFPLCLLKA